MLLPFAEYATVDIGKLRDYCLNPNHEVGKQKARVFPRPWLYIPVVRSVWIIEPDSKVPRLITCYVM